VLAKAAASRPPPRARSTKSSSPTLSPRVELNHVITPGHQLITLPGLVGPRRLPATVLVDSGATSNFISTSFVRTHALALVASASSSLVTLADGRQQPTGGIAASVLVKLGSYAEPLDLTATDISGYDLILGMPWLAKYNPRIDWRGKTITFTDAADAQHVLSKAPTGAARWSAPSPSSAAHLNLISSRAIERAHRRDELAYCCLVYPQHLQSLCESTPANPSAAGADGRQAVPAPPRVEMQAHACMHSWVWCAVSGGERRCVGGRVEAVQCLVSAAVSAAA